MTPKVKFMKGLKLDSKELMGIPLVDRCRYVVDKYFKNGWIRNDNSRMEGK